MEPYLKPITTPYYVNALLELPSYNSWTKTGMRERESIIFKDGLYIAFKAIIYDGTEVLVIMNNNMLWRFGNSLPIKSAFDTLQRVGDKEVLSYFKNFDYLDYNLKSIA